MDKRKIGAIVGVIGVTGAIAASQLIDIDRTTADHMTRDLTKQYNNSQEASPQAPKEAKEEKDFVEEKVFDPVQNVEYVVQKDHPVVEAAEESKLEAPASKEVEITLPQEIKPANEQAKTGAEEKPSLVAEADQKEGEGNQPEEGTDRSAVDSAQAPGQGNQKDPVEIPLPANEKEEVKDFKGMVNVENLNIRADASETSRVLAGLSYGDLVLGHYNNGWVSFRVEGEMGYVKADYLDRLTDAAYDIQLARKKRIADEKAAVEAARKAAEEQKKKEEEEKKKQEEEEREREAAEKAEEERLAKEKEEREAREAEARKKAEAEQKEQRSVVKQIKGFVQAQYANLRQEPTKDSPIVGGLLLNSKIDGFLLKNGWIEVKYNGSKAYILGRLVGDKKVVPPQPAVEEEPEEQKEESNKRSGYVKYLQGVNVRQEPDRTSARLGYLPVNTKVEGTLENGWIKLQYQGQTGYIIASALSDKKQELPAPAENNNEEAPVVESASMAQMIELAKAQLGKAYIYATQGPNSFDCSGLTYYLYRSLGVTLYRCSRDQAKNGYQVSRDHLKPGDLLFFRGMNSVPGSDAISHVGFYIGGRMMIHASNPTRGVVMDNIDSNYYTTHFVTARRILN